MKRSDLISSVAAIISGIALVASVKSCQVSEQALEVAKLEYQGTRSLVLNGEVQSDNESIKLFPQDQSFLLQQLHYRFPSSLGGSRQPALAPDFKLRLATEIDKLKTELTKRFPSKKDIVTVGLEARIPFLVESFSTVKGNQIKDRSIYTLNFQFSVFEEPEKRPQVKLLGISFSERLPAEKTPEKELERIWNAASKG